MGTESGQRVRSFRTWNTPFAQFGVQIVEILQSLLDLVEDIRTRTAFVFVAQFDQHLADTPDRPYGVVRVIFPYRMHESGGESRFIVAWHAVWPFCVGVPSTEY